MIKALCYQCGHAKAGAWLVCPSCKHQPGDDIDDRCRHMIITPHFLPQDKLREIATAIKSGQHPQFKKEELDMVRQVVKDKIADEKGQKSWARQILFSVGAVVLIIIFVVLGMIFK